MVKIIIGLVLAFLAGGSWLYLDCLNKQELGVTEQMQHGVTQARAEAKRRAEAKAIFEYQIQADLSSCQAAAEKAKNDYMVLIQKAVPSKRGVAVVPQAIADEAEQLMTATKAECKQAYDTHIKNGV